MSNPITIPSGHAILRGKVDSLGGRQGSKFFSWLRFDLGYVTVLAHGLFLVPPELEEGDEVIVAGKRRGDRFDAMACLKIGETEANREARHRNRVLRRRFWFILAALPAALLLCLAIVSNPTYFDNAAFAGVAFFMPVLASYYGQRIVELELELAICRLGEVL